MSIDLSELDLPRQAWLPLTGKLRGVDVQVKYSSPKQAEKFRQRLVRDGIMRSTKGSDWQIANGREDDFFKAFADFYVLDWRGDIKPDGTEYTSENMGRILAAYGSAFEQVTAAISDDSDFFISANGG